MDAFLADPTALLAACPLSAALALVALGLCGIALFKGPSRSPATAVDAACRACAWAGPRAGGPRATFLTSSPRDHLLAQDPDALDEVSGLLADQFRHHAPRGADLDHLPAPMQAALLVLAAAMASPHALPPLVARVLARAHRMGPVATRADARLLRELAARPKAMPLLGWAMKGHAWWETAALEMMAHARARGSWLVADDLRFLQETEPALFAALCATGSGACVPEGAALLGHWQAELAAGTRLDMPRVDEGKAAVCGAAMSRG